MIDPEAIAVDVKLVVVADEQRLRLNVWIRCLSPQCEWGPWQLVELKWLDLRKDVVAIGVSHGKQE